MRHGLKLGFALLSIALLVSRGADQVTTPNLGQRTLAGSGAAGPTVVGCTALLTGTTTWSANGSPYILPWNDPSIPTSDSTRQPNCTTTDGTGKTVGADLEVGPGATLTIDGSNGPVQIFSHGAGITVSGGQIQTVNTSSSNFVTFDASPDAASWDGLTITTGTDTNNQLLRGTGQLDSTSIAHALNAIRIDSGATSLAGVTSDAGALSTGYGLVFTNGAIGPSYFDGIDSTNTPVQLIGQRDGQFGTVNNIGSQALKITFDPQLPNYPTSLGHPLDVEGQVFGSSVPFGQTLCLPNQTCAAGTIGNDGIDGNFSGESNVVISDNNFYRAGSFGIDLESAAHPRVTNNDLVCNGSGSPTPITSCTPSGSLLTYSAIYLNGVTANLLPDPSHQPITGASGAVVSNNVGQQNGLDALVLSGDVTSDVSWITPTNDPNGPTVDPPHDLGYMIGNLTGDGSLELHGGNLTVKHGDVVKVKGGGITLSGGSLIASDSNSAVKTFTSMRDNTIGIQACPSVFVQGCPPVLPTGTSNGLPGGEWTGIDLVGATANITNANLLFATKAISISGTPSSLIAGPGGGSYGLLLTNSHIGPTFSDSVASSGVPLDVESTSFCRIDTAALNANGQPNANLERCVLGAPGSDAGPGDHGINADFSGIAAGGSGLVLKNNDFRGSRNEAVLGSGLAGRPVVIESNTIEAAGSYGMQLIGSDNLTLEANVVQASGNGNPLTYPAIYLNGVKGANLDNSAEPTPPLSSSQLACSPNCIRWNAGAGNGLDAIAFHGTTQSSLTWISPANVSSVAPLGYLLDDSLAINGNLTLNSHDILESRQGTVTISGKLSSTSALVSSLRQGASNLPAGFPAVSLPTCGSVFEPRNVSNNGSSCPAPAAGDWGGLVLNGQQQNVVDSSHIYYASTALAVNGPVGVTNADIRHSAQNGIAFGAQTLSISGGSISDTGREAILGSGLNGADVGISGVSIDGAGTYGIRLVPNGATSLNGNALTLVGNTITRSGTQGGVYPAISLGSVVNGKFLPPTATGVTHSVQGNSGGGNGLDALVFQGQLSNDLVWTTARNSAGTHALGYLLSGTLDMGGNVLTVNAGDVVKTAAGGAINMSGGTLNGTDTASASGKIFTSLSDNSAGVTACPSVLVADCTASQGTYWHGIFLGGSGANGSLVNAAVRDATTPLAITSGATSTIGSSSFGLAVTRSTIGPAAMDAIDSTGTSLSVSNSTITTAVHGLVADFTGSGGSPPTLFLTGNRFAATTAEAILGEGLAGRAVWIADNHIQLGADTFGIRLLNADALVLRNNNVSTNPAVTSATEVHYPAIYLSKVNGDFVHDIRGNVGSNNGLDAIVFDGTAQSGMQWVSPTNPVWASGPTTTHALGYMLDGPLTVSSGTLTIGSGTTGAVVESLGGPITVSGGSLDANGAGLKTFTSVNDAHAPVLSCPSFLGPCGAKPGDWGGLVLTQSLPSSTAKINNSLITYAATALYTDGGPISGTTPNVVINHTTILNTLKDGISSFDTPIDVENSYVGDATSPLATNVPVPVNQPNIGAHGIIASYFSPPGCPASCQVLTLKLNHVAWTAADGIVANGLGGEPVDMETNTVANAHTYGIRMVGADTLRMIGNTVNNSGVGAVRYPGVYLNGVKADLQTTTTAGTVVQGNNGFGNGLDAIVFHGEATNNLTWQTAAAATVVTPFGYLLDGSLTVDGTLTTRLGDVVKVLNGGIKINPLNGSGGVLNATDATIFTSLKDPDITHGLQVCGSVFVPTSCTSVTPSASDWNGINIDAGTSFFVNSKILYASRGITISGASLHVSGASFVGISGVALQSSGSQPLTVDCSSIRQNGTGIQADYATVNDSDIYGNATDLNGNSNLQASNDDYLGATPHTTGAAVNATPLSSQQPSVTALNLTSTNQLAKNDQYNNPAFGIGKLSLAATFNRKMSQAVPNATFGLYDRNTLAFTGQTFSFDATGLANGGWSSNGKTWTANDYQLQVNTTLPPIADIGAQAGENLLKLSGARDCIPAENDTLSPTPPNADSNLMHPNPTNQAFSAAILPTVLAANAAAGPYGGTANLSAHLTANGAPAPALQTITFQVPGQTPVTAKTNGSGDASATAPLGNLAANQAHTYQASYGGDPDLFFTPAPSASGPPITAALTVTPAATTTSTPTTSLASATFGQAVTFTAKVTSNVSGGIDPGAADGTVSFQSGTTVFCSAALGTGTTTNEAKCTTNTAPASATAYSVSAVYAPPVNGNFQGSTSASSVNQTVAQATTTTLTPGADTNPSTFGQPVKLSAKVTSTYRDPQAGDGSVAFMEGVNTICTGSMGSGATANEAACTTDQLAVGTHTITAVFNPANGNYAGSTAATTLSQVVNAAPTTTSTPTGTPNPSNSGDAVLLSATVSAADIPPGSSDGSITFKEGTTALCTATLGTGGSASCSYTFTTAGAHSVTAVYTPIGSNFLASTSSTLTQNVN